MSISRQFCFTHSPGKEVYLFKLTNGKGTEALISNYGGIITSFKIRSANGSFNDIVLGFDKMEDYLNPDYLNNYPWMGCAIGRYANRIKNGIAEIDGKKYKLTQNKGNDQLHGGTEGFDKKIWEVVTAIDSVTPSLELRYISPDGEEGFPGNLEVLLKFELNDNDELSYEFNATTDKTTIVNLTHHSYFNLNNGKGTVEEHEIKIYSSQILGQDEGLVVNGELLQVSNSIFDFNEFRPIGKKWEDKEIYDQSFVLDKNNNELSLVAEARSAGSKTLLQVYSSEPVVHFYSGKWIPPVKAKSGNTYGACSGFCLETHIHPNAINIPGFPNTILKRGEKYHHKTIYRVSELK
ncbi:MAG TPA: aldose epimerase family protein [Chitinophagaceae bacterium]